MKQEFERTKGLATIAIHAGQAPDPHHGAVMTPVVMASTFAQPEPGKPLHYEYSRSNNPTREALEQCLAALEGANYGLAFASGTAATLAVFHTLRPGDHVICGLDLYGGTFRILNQVMAPLGVTIDVRDLTRLDELEAAITPRTRLVWFETPSNPTLRLVDIEGVVARVRGRARVVVDNTFASPVFQQPLSFGVDAVVHSTTKYLNGHSDVIGGAILTRSDELAERLRFLQNALGGVPSPMDCYLTLRGLKTLPIRMYRHAENAQAVAERLAGHSAVERVFYPGLNSHPEHALALRQMRGFSGMVSFELRGGQERSRQFLSSLSIFTLAESLGGVESLAELPALMTHAGVAPEARQAAGVTDTLVRLSVGIEDIEDLWEDLSRSLECSQ